MAHYLCWDVLGRMGNKVNNILNLVKIMMHKKKQFWLYVIIGLSGATLDFIFYIIFYKLIKISPAISSFISVSIGIINNFILNSRHNFKTTDLQLYRFLNFYFVGMMGAILSSVMIYVFYDKLGYNAIVSKVMTIVPVVLLQYFINKHTSFRKSKN